MDTLGWVWCLFFSICFAQMSCIFKQLLIVGLFLRPLASALKKRTWTGNIPSKTSQEQNVGKAALYFDLSPLLSLNMMIPHFLHATSIKNHRVDQYPSSNFILDFENKSVTSEFILLTCNDLSFPGIYFGQRWIKYNQIPKLSQERSNSIPNQNLAPAKNSYHKLDPKIQP